MNLYCKSFLVLSLFLLSTYTAQAQFKTLPIVNLFFKNQFDKNGLHQGRWFFDTEATGADEKMKTRGRYRHGLMVGKWRTYDADGNLRKLEKGRIAGRKNYIESTEFYPNGQVAVHGSSIMDRTGDKPRFYRQGDWYYYNQDASLDKTVFYQEGWPTKTTFADGKEVTSEPQKSPTRVLKPGEKTTSPGPGRPGIRVYKDKETEQMIVIRYLENGDSTITVLPENRGQK
jgi:antitoxin component YwqK of YwqJK toxin-antitoxin module